MGCGYVGFWEGGSWTQKQLNVREALGTLGFFEEELEVRYFNHFISTQRGEWVSRATTHNTG